MTTVEIGEKYEKFIFNLIKKEYDNVWLWKFIPDNILKELEITCFDSSNIYDIGVDIVAIKDKKLTLIQCKGFDKCNVDIPHLAGFNNFITEYRKDNNEYVVYYSSELSSRIKSLSKGIIKYKYVPREIYENINSNIIQLIPKPYQIE